MIIFLPFRGEKSKIMVDSDKPMCYNLTPPRKTVKKAKKENKIIRCRKLTVKLTDNREER